MEIIKHIFSKIEKIRKISTIEAKKEKIREQLQSEKKNKINCAKAYERHMKNADDLALKAQMEEKLSLLKESNESRKRSCDMKECIEVSAAKIIKLKEELKKLI